MSDVPTTVNADTVSMLDPDSNMTSKTLLLAGRIGHGKSATGNSIIGRKVYKTSTSSGSRTPNILKETSYEYGKPVTVLDGVDIDDLNQESEDYFKSLFDALNRVFAMLIGGVNAIVLVLKYGVRFTKQEKDAVSLIRAIFGQNALKKHGVIVMSHGDNFDLDMEDEGRSFKEWCSAQTGDVKSLFEECGSRIVLFNNKAEPDKMKEQNQLLMSEVSKIRSPYTQQDYEEAEAKRLKILVKIKLPRLERESNDVIDGIYTRLDKADSCRDVIKELEDVMRDLQNHKQRMIREDENTGVLDHLLVQISTLEGTIKNKIDRERRALGSPPTNISMPAGYDGSTSKGFFGKHQRHIMVLIPLAAFMLFIFMISYLFQGDEADT